MDRQRALRAVKLAHTAIWAFFVACIVAIPLAAHRGRFGVAAVLTAIVLLEVAVLAANGWRCPLTPIAARYTDAREANFDIYLPRVVARYNKQLFGSLFVAGVAYALWLWRTQGG